MTEKLHPKCLKLLNHLRDNSREKLTSISKKSNIPISTLFDLLKQLQENVITKSTVLLDFNQLGYYTRAKLFLKISSEDYDAVKKHLECHANVNTVYKINNDWSFLVETVHKNIKDLDTFIENLSKNFAVEDKKIHYLIDEIKREGFVVQGAKQQ
jgi:DNA-binding Lrp family transcriptional regulator